MHYHLEIVLPPCDNIEEALTTILMPFDENATGEDRNNHAFWDYWTIGGRYNGRKLLAHLDKAQLDKFEEQLQAMQVTVSGFQAGKPSLQPTSQIPAIDKLWRETFPQSPIKECPLFDHYKGRSGDIMPFLEVPPTFECGHIIFAGMDYQDKELEAKYMLRREIWNGVTWQETAWDGTLARALDAHLDHLKNAKPEYAKKLIPHAGWNVVTVDYHN